MREYFQHWLRRLRRQESTETISWAFWHSIPVQIPKGDRRTLEFFGYRYEGHGGNVWIPNNLAEGQIFNVRVLIVQGDYGIAPAFRKFSFYVGAKLYWESDPRIDAYLENSQMVHFIWLENDLRIRGQETPFRAEVELVCHWAAGAKGEVMVSMVGDLTRPIV
jgi:hypothetical protein